jgi:ribosomal protein L37AE/L43A
MEIALTCPQCGSQVGLEEDASVFHCQYCGSMLKPTGRNEVQSFFFPPRGSKEQVEEALKATLAGKGGRPLNLQDATLLYAPYWKVKGLLFQWAFGKKYLRGDSSAGTAFDQFKKLRAVLYHRTFPAFRTVELGIFSLGLRAQVLKMFPYQKEAMGNGAVVLTQEVSLEEAVERALQTPYAGAADEKLEFLKTGMIGERYSLLYFPYYCFRYTSVEGQTTLVVDALSHKVVKGNLPLEELIKGPDNETVPCKPLDFIPFKCPNCGWTLPFRPHTMIHLCRTCGRAWEERGGVFQEVPFRTVSKGKYKGECRYLPFWRLTVTISTPRKHHRTLTDFYELFPLPRVLDRERLARRPIHFFIPAFPIRNAVAVDKFAAQLTKTQPILDEAQPRDPSGFTSADVWLPLQEAEEMAALLLYSMAPQRSKPIQSLIKEARLHVEEKRLLWLPFFEEGIFLREANTDFAIQKNCVEVYGEV